MNDMKNEQYMFWEKKFIYYSSGRRPPQVRGKYYSCSNCYTGSAIQTPFCPYCGLPSNKTWAHKKNLEKNK